MQIDVLDHGYINLIETWGSDERIIEAARMSTSKGFLGWQPESLWRCDQCAYDMRVLHNDKLRQVQHVPAPRLQPHAMRYVEGHHGDTKLLNFLYQHKHMTPFEMAGMIIEVQAPIFVFREWHRHRTQSYNELSARYTQLPDLFYVPSVERMQASAQDNINKQGSGGHFPIAAAQSWIQEIKDHYETSRELYLEMLNSGVAREVARIIIPVGQISRMRASANLRNWLAFLTLRMDPAAQWEIRQYANALGKIIAEHFPHTWELFAEVTPPVNHA